MLAGGERTEKLDGLFIGMNAEFIVKSRGADAVLTGDELLLVLGRVVPHEHSVHRLAARVTAHRQPAEPHGLGQLAEGEVNFRACSSAST